jgi:hypothetical protein
MENPTRQYIQHVIECAQAHFSNVRILRESYAGDTLLGLIDLEGTWHTYRVLITVVYRSDGSIRYSYYVLEENNRLLYGFDNHRDKYALKLKYTEQWAAHRDEEIPHRHDAQRQVALTDFMTVDMIVAWLETHIEHCCQ